MAWFLALETQWPAAPWVPIPSAVSPALRSPGQTNAFAQTAATAKAGPPQPPLNRPASHPARSRKPTAGHQVLKPSLCSEAPPSATQTQTANPPNSLMPAHCCSARYAMTTEQPKQSPTANALQALSRVRAQIDQAWPAMTSATSLPETSRPVMVCTLKAIVNGCSLG